MLQGEGARLALLLRFLEAALQPRTLQVIILIKKMILVRMVRARRTHVWGEKSGPWSDLTAGSQG